MSIIRNSEVSVVQGCQRCLLREVPLYIRQCVGIPTGTDCARMIKTNLMKAKTFSNTMRYIDDLLIHCFSHISKVKEDY